MIFRHIFFLLTIVWCAGMSVHAQQPLPEIVVGIEIDVSNFPSGDNQLRNTYYNRVMTGLAKNGIGSNGFSAIAVIAQVNEGEAIYTATAPVRIVQTFYFELRMLNSLSGEVFATYSEEVGVIRKSSTEAYKAAILKLNFSGTDFQRFMEAGKVKIRSYYQSNCKAILADAERLVAQRAFLQTISRLQSMPTEASTCTSEANEMIDRAYTAYLEIACADHLQRARALIANRQFDEGVLAIMAIPPGVSCQEEVSKAIRELKDYRMEIDEMNWNRLLKLHQIEVERTDRQMRFLENLAFLNALSHQYQITGQNTIISVIR